MELWDGGGDLVRSILSAYPRVNCHRIALWHLSVPYSVNRRTFFFFPFFLKFFFFIIHKDENAIKDHKDYRRREFSIVVEEAHAF
jgi:hypothetical protein